MCWGAFVVGGVAAVVLVVVVVWGMFGWVTFIAACKMLLPKVARLTGSSASCYLSPEIV